MEALLVVGVQLQGGLGVLDVVVGKIAHQTAGEGRQSRDSWAPVLCQEPAQAPAGMGGPLLPVPAAPQPQHPVGTRDLQRGVVPQKGVTPPALAVRGGLQQKAVPALCPQDTQGLDRGDKIGQEHPADGDFPVGSGGSDGSGLL